MPDDQGLPTWEEAAVMRAIEAAVQSVCSDGNSDARRVAQDVLVALRPHLAALLAQARAEGREAYKAEVLAWLRHKEAKWRKTAKGTTGTASGAAGFYAAAYFNAVDGIELGEPERRALSAAPGQGGEQREGETSLCEGCPPADYPTEITRCLPCPRRIPPAPGQGGER